MTPCHVHHLIGMFGKTESLSLQIHWSTGRTNTKKKWMVPWYHPQPFSESASLREAKTEGTIRHLNLEL